MEVGMTEDTVTAGILRKFRQ